jgi:ADP-ribosylglycohydrolase
MMLASDFKLRVTWAQPEDLIAHTIAQAIFEGVDVEEEIKRWRDNGGSIVPLLAGASKISGSSETRELARELILLIEKKIQMNPELDYKEFLEDLPEGSNHELPSIDTFLGAWLGRAVGCLLGKPVEKVHRLGIRNILESSGRWPLDYYFTAQGVPQEVLDKYPWNTQSAPTCLQENIDGMPEDDDLNYPLIALLTVEKFGRDFNTDHIADQWLKLLPGGRVYTAERITYRNLLDGIPPSEAGSTLNPFKEWIGAWIRADFYGWINPGNPAEAARLALKDSWLSHRRNGIYGASMVAAMCAVSMVSKDIDEVIESGFDVIPIDSELSRICRISQQLGKSDVEYEEAVDRIYAECAHMHWVHTVNNAALGILALTRSHGDFSKAITLTVMGGWDTDSIGATVGSICGAMSGADAIDVKWTTPIDNRLASSIPGCNSLRFTDLARRTRSLV